MTWRQIFLKNPYMLWGFILMFVLGCGEGFKTSSTPMASSIASQNTAAGIEKNLLKNAKVRFWSGSLASGYGVMQFRIINGEEYSVYYTELPVSLGTSPIMFFIDDSSDDPANISSVALFNSNGQSVATGACVLQFGFCSIGWSQISVAQYCKANNFTWTYPATGNYKLEATYRDGSTRKVEFKIADPCTTLYTSTTSMQKSDRMPASTAPKKKK